jgi:hypothetical protein
VPTTVRQAFRSAGLEPAGVVGWGEVPDTPQAGVYVVALTADPDSLNGVIPEAPLARQPFSRWLTVRPDLTLDGQRPTENELVARITAFWLPDEVILYIGKAAALSRRVADYYSTPIRARRPHAGGYFLKLLENLDQLFVHYAPCDDPAGAEDQMLAAFCASISPGSLRTLRDPAHPFPFANLEWPPGTRKAHGLRGAREPRAPRAKADRRSGGGPSKSPVVRRAASLSYRTQRVTEADLRVGQIRIPVIGPTKALFPPERGPVAASLRGRSLSVRWDPRMGLDRERSGVLRFEDRAALRELVRADEVLRVTPSPSGGVSID